MPALIIAIICAIICTMVASSKGRNAIGWFFLGFFFGLFGLIAVLVASDVKAREDKENALANENRRLQEQIHQERIKTEQLRVHTQQRLDTHDQILNVNTRPTLATTDRTQPDLLNACPETSGSISSNPENGSVLDPESIQTRGWYYQKGNDVIGPLDYTVILSELNKGVISLTTNVWHETMKTWTPAERVDCLRRGDMP